MSTSVWAEAFVFDQFYNSLLILWERRCTGEGEILGICKIASYFAFKCEESYT